MLDFSKMKAFADNRLNMASMMKIVSERAEDIVREKKVEYPGYHSFSFSHAVFKSYINYNP